jgi:peroxiredoxin
MRRLIPGLLALAAFCVVNLAIAEEPKPAKPKVAVGEKAPDFQIKGPDGKTISLAELTAKGPVLVRLTCGCSGCDKELTYFQEVSEAYKGQGLVSLYVFKEPDAKVAKYVKDKKLSLLYAVDTKGESWNVFQTKTMPTNFLIDKGGKIVAIAAGCDVSGLIAQKVSEKAAKLVDSKPVDVKEKAQEKKKEK